MTPLASEARPNIASQTALLETKALLEATAELWLYRKLVSRTVEVFGDEVKASEWLSRPNPDLGDDTPLGVAQKNGYDYRVIEPLLIRIEHGIDY